MILAIDLEGTEVCDWLTSKGITAVLLKYRVPGLEAQKAPDKYPKSGPYPASLMALEDAQRTVGLVRFHAAEWHIDPHKIGVLGFSAGGHLVTSKCVLKAGRPRLRAATHKVSSDGMASVSGEVAENDRHDFGVDVKS
jgi:acetyl esterase/lipase